MKYFHIFTYGCQMNKSDSEIISGSLLSEGMQLVNNPEEADVLIFNTCAVRGNAEDRAFSRIREFNSLRKKNKKEQIIVLAGCVPQYEKEAVLNKYPFIDVIVGTNSYEYLPEILRTNHQGAVINIHETKQTTKKSEIINRDDKSDQAFLPIMYGCDNYCSYCIVPYTRGREVSRAKDDIFSAIETIGREGYKKILLLGQNVNSYGKGVYVDYFFSNLLEDILNSYPWIEKLEFLTSHPKDINANLIKVIAKQERIGREIHFPIQHGDNRILELMNRGYTSEQYKQKVESLRDNVLGVRISTDLIVGFPGETEEEFLNTIKVVKEIGFFRVNTAAFSPRKGTKAASMSGQIDEKTKKRRLNELNQTVKNYAFKA